MNKNMLPVTSVARAPLPPRVVSPFAVQNGSGTAIANLGHEAFARDNDRDTKTVYTALECLYCLSSPSYKHPNRSILESHHALEQVLTACDVFAGEAVVFHWACTLIGLLYSKRVAQSHVNGRLCRLLLQALGHFTHEMAICEYGLKSLAFVSYVAVTVELRRKNTLHNKSMALTLSASADGQTANNDPSRQLSLTASKPTAQYLHDARALPLAIKLYIRHSPSGAGGVGGSVEEDLSVHALTSAFLAMGNLMYHHNPSKIAFLTHMHTQKLYYPNGQYSQTSWISLLEGSLTVAKRYLTRLSTRKTAAQQKSEKQRRQWERMRKSNSQTEASFDPETDDNQSGASLGIISYTDSIAERYVAKYGALDLDTFYLLAAYFHCLGNALSIPRMSTVRDGKLHQEALLLSTQYEAAALEIPYAVRSGQGK